jgi:uncharacterized repeat protein (TIGR01451 family)
VVVKGTVTSSSCGSWTNTATGTSTDEPSSKVGPNNSSAAGATVECPDVTVTKTPVNATVPAGSPIRFRIEARNDGNGVAENVTITDQLPAGFDWVSGSGFCSITSGTLSCNFGNLVPGGTATITVGALTTMEQCGTVSNKARTAATNEPANKRGNNSSTASLKIACPDLLVTNVPAAPSVGPGGQVSFTITIRNVGDAAATDVNVMSGLPYGIDWQSSTASCAVYPGAIGCSFGTIAAGESKVVTLQATMPVGMCGAVGMYVYAWATNEQTMRTLNNMVYGETTVRCS